MKSLFVKKLGLLGRRTKKKQQRHDDYMDMADGDDCSTESALHEEEETSQDEKIKDHDNSSTAEDSSSEGEDGIPRYVQMKIPPMIPPSYASPPIRKRQSESSKVESIAKAAAALDNYGNQLFEKGEYDVAMASYSKALRLKKKTLQSLQHEHDGVAQQEEDHDTIHTASSSSPQAEAMMASVATSINNIGYLRQRSGAAAEETMAAYQDSLRIKQQILGKDSLSVGKTLNNIGSVYFLTKDYDKAMEAYREACSIMVHNLGANHVDVATVYSNMGDVHLAQGSSDLACENYRKALNIRWEQLGERDAKVVRLLEKVALIEMGELDNAQQLGAEAVSATREQEDHQGTIPVALDNLMDEVKRDMKYVDSVKRQLAVDMVKEKLQMRREMRAINDGIEALRDPPSTPLPLTPGDRTHALACVKNRLKQLRESKRIVTPETEKKHASLAEKAGIEEQAETIESNDSNLSEDQRITQKENIVEHANSSTNVSIARERHVKAAEDVKERLERLSKNGVKPPIEM